MGITIGKLFPQAVGVDVVDESGREHLGIIEFPVPILKGSSETIRKLRTQLYKQKFQKLMVVDFPDIAQSCKTYTEYIHKIAGIQETDLSYFGIAIYGDKKMISSLTGNMPLLR
ncbi:MAG: DUF2000 domain-containing protein [Lachnospiraceae bacterium]